MLISIPFAFRSTSSWMKAPDQRAKLVADLNGFTVLRTAMPACLNYHLMDGQTVAGHAALLDIPGNNQFSFMVRWLDEILLEPEYRGKGWMQKLLTVVLADRKRRPILLHAHQSNVRTYEAVGFRRMTEKEEKKFADAFAVHETYMDFDRPMNQYVPMIYTKE